MRGDSEPKPSHLLDEKWGETIKIQDEHLNEGRIDCYRILSKDEAVLFTCGVTMSSWDVEW